MEQVRRAYSARAAEYIELFDSGDHVHPDDLAMISRHLACGRGAVLDVGCGPGHLTAYLCSLGVAATGIDLVPEFIDHARVTHTCAPFVLGSMGQLPVAGGSVAGVLAWYSLIHVPPDDLGGVLAELRRVTAPGGTLVAGFVDGEQAVTFEHKVVTAYSWPADEFSDRLRRAGFTEVDRGRRSGAEEPSGRPHAAIAAIAG